MADAVGAALRARALTIVTAGGVRAADDAIGVQRFDAAVVDIGLPDGSGLEWCRTARRSGYELPILVLTARNGVADRVAGLEAGADDYLGKPFSVEELMARLRALTRRGPRWTDGVRHFGSVVVDRDCRARSDVDGRRAAAHDARARHRRAARVARRVASSGATRSSRPSGARRARTRRRA